jgi:hypothetical protein
LKAAGVDVDEALGKVRLDTAKVRDIHGAAV